MECGVVPYLPLYKKASLSARRKAGFLLFELSGLQKINSRLHTQSKKSFTVSKNFLILGVPFLSRVASSCRSSSFCSLLSLVGVSTTTVNRWLPRRRGLPTSGMPLSRRTNSLPVWVPSGISYVTLPSMVGTSISAPRAAWVK